MNTFSVKEKKIPFNDTYDVLVAGGGPAGCAAAIGASREGKKTLLVEATSALGGMSTSGLVPTIFGLHDGEKIISRGLAETVVKMCHKNTPHLHTVMAVNPLFAPTIDPEMLKRIYDTLAVKANVKIIFNTQVCSVEKTGDDEIGTVLVSNKRGLSALKAKIYIDCTGDGDLAAWTGALFEKGDKNGKMQPSSLCFILTNIDQYNFNHGPKVFFFDPDSPVHKAIKSDKYNFINEIHACCIPIGPNTVGINAGHIHDFDHTNPEDNTQALLFGRELAAQYQEAFAEYLPAFRNSFLVSTGNILGVRETRRIIGDYVLNINDFNTCKNFHDEICRNAYGIDIHRSKSEEIDLAKKSIEQIKQEILMGHRTLPKGKSMGIPYRCLTPKGIKNLLVAGRCISSDRQVNGSIRIIACSLNTGEAAGISAALACDTNCNVHDIDTDELRKRLKQYNAYLPDV